jgi:hypothetical protein
MSSSWCAQLRRVFATLGLVPGDHPIDLGLADHGAVDRRHRAGRQTGARAVCRCLRAYRRRLRAHDNQADQHCGHKPRKSYDHWMPLQNMNTHQTGPEKSPARDLASTLLRRQCNRS